MTTHDWRTRLEAGDPALDGGLDANEAAEIRRRMLAAVQPAPPQAWPWPRPLFVAATLALTIGVGAAAGRRLGPPPDPSPTSPSAIEIAETMDERRQLQFSTPGGTRIIWVFDPQFTMKETMP
jgi:hypothetical protein